MNNIGIFKNEDNILLNESFDGFLKIFINLSIASVSAKMAIMSLADGNKITAICYAVVAGILLVVSAGYLIINIVGKAVKCFELKADKIVGDAKTISAAENKLIINQVVLGLLALLAVGSLYAFSAWTLAGLIVTKLL